MKIYHHNWDECGAVFKRKSHLDSYIRGVHIGERLASNLCGKEFQSKSNLTRHIKRLHKWMTSCKLISSLNKRNVIITNNLSKVPLLFQVSKTLHETWTILKAWPVYKEVWLHFNQSDSRLAWHQKQQTSPGVRFSGKSVPWLRHAFEKNQT